MVWPDAQGMRTRPYTCGYCGSYVASDKGFASHYGNLEIHICADCNQPSFFHEERQVPGVPYGEEVGNLPDDIAKLYSEARNCMASSSPTAAVLTCRKILMNVAVDKGAPEGEKFIQYVDYLDSKGYVPPDGRGWVDHIRKKSNEANHEIVLMERNDAEELITFLAMLLKLIYEFPGKIPPP